MNLLKWQIEKLQKIRKRWALTFLAIVLLFVLDPWYILDIPYVSTFFGWLNSLLYALFSFRFFTELLHTEVDFWFDILRWIAVIILLLWVASLILLPILKGIDQAVAKKQNRPRNRTKYYKPFMSFSQVMPIYRRILSVLRLKALMDESEYTFMDKSMTYVRIQRIAKCDTPTAKKDELRAWPNGNRIALNESFYGVTMPLVVYQGPSGAFLKVPDSDLPEERLEINRPVAIPAEVDGKTLLVYVITLIGDVEA